MTVIKFKDQVLKYILHVLVLYCLFNTISCSPDLSDDAIPFVPFSEILINLNLPEYNRLRTTGGYIEINGGVRGIILYHKSASEYIAYERNCSYQPNSAGATVNVHISTLYMEDPSCNSTFDFSSGSPTGGVAWRPLRKYETLLTGTQLTITDNIVD